jgi:predicted LPLAT superfamily acyltransferase
MTGAPLLTFFVSQQTPGNYHIKISKGRQAIAINRKERTRAVLESAQAYAAALEQAARENPFEWYHFEPFLGKKINKKEHQSRSAKLRG